MKLKCTSGCAEIMFVALKGNKGLVNYLFSSARFLSTKHFLLDFFGDFLHFWNPHMGSFTFYVD